MPVLLVVLIIVLGLGPAAAAQTKAPIPADLFSPPGGPYPVGTREYLWVDERRPEVFTKDPTDRRHLLVQIWYPAEPAPDAKPALYVRTPDELGEFRGLDPVRHVTTHSVMDAPLAGQQTRYPVLVYNHGGGWTRFSGTFTTETMASHGYIVVSIDHTGFNKTVLFPDGYRFAADTFLIPKPSGKLRDDALANWDFLETRYFPEWLADARFVLDQVEQLDRAPDQPFRNRLDLDRIGMFGWSFGGATSIQMSKDDPRVKAAVDQDGQLFGDVDRTGTHRPVMLMHNADDGSSQTGENKAVMAELQGMVAAKSRAMLDRSSADWYEVTIANTNHGHFSDLLLFYPSRKDQLDPRRAHEIINAYTLAFFDKHLRGRDAPLLEGPSSAYGEVAFTRK